MDLAYLAHIATALIPHSLVGIALLQKAEGRIAGNEQAAADFAERYEDKLAARIKRAIVVAIGPKHLQRQAFDKNFDSIKTSFAQGLVRLYQSLEAEADRIRKTKGRNAVKPRINSEAAGNYYAGLFGNMFESVLILGASINVAAEFASHVNSFADPRWVKKAIRTAEEEDGLDRKTPGAIDGVLQKLIAGDQRFIARVVRFIESGADEQYDKGAPINIDPAAHIDNIPDYDINGKHRGKAQPETAPEVEPVTMPAAKPATPVAKSPAKVEGAKPVAKATEEPVAVEPVPATPEKKKGRVIVPPDIKSGLPVVVAQPERSLEEIQDEYRYVLFSGDEAPITRLQRFIAATKKLSQRERKALVSQLEWRAFVIETYTHERDDFESLRGAYQTFVECRTILDTNKLLGSSASNNFIRTQVLANMRGVIVAIRDSANSTNKQSIRRLSADAKREKIRETLNSEPFIKAILADGVISKKEVTIAFVELTQGNLVRSASLT